MHDEDIERAAKFFLKEDPAFRSACYKTYLEQCEETGVEPDDEVFEDLALRAAKEWVADERARFNELFPMEEMKRLLREEAARLRGHAETSPIVIDEELANALAARMNEQLSRHYPRHHPPND
jgi:hypothetical protein